MKLNKFSTLVTLLVSVLIGTSTVRAADLLDATPIAEQPAELSVTVDAVNYEFSVLGGAIERNVIGSASNYMFTASVAAPLPYFANVGHQLDLAGGLYDGDFFSAAAAYHLFWRNSNVGAFGIYGDWSYLNPEHAGRVGAEISVYHDRFTLDVLAGVRFGQNVFTDFFDEVDLSYYFTDNTRGSIGHRWTSRGHVANVSFEHLMSEHGAEGWSVFGEVEFGEDNYTAGFGGVRYAVGSTAATLIERDRKSSMPVRIPRNLASVSQCAFLRNPLPATGWRSELSKLCASEEEINSHSNHGIFK